MSDFFYQDFARIKYDHIAQGCVNNITSLRHCVRLSSQERHIFVKSNIFNLQHKKIILRVMAAH
jgi:hypothetical protein